MSVTKWITAVIMCKLSLLVFQCSTAPIYQNQMYPKRNIIYLKSTAQPRPFLSLGDWISSSEWFPIEINVPDTVQNILGELSSMSNTVTSGISGIASGVVQRIPLINNWVLHDVPRPFQYAVMEATQQMGSVQFNPFNIDANFVPLYP